MQYYDYIKIFTSLAREQFRKFHMQPNLFYKYALLIINKLKKRSVFLEDKNVEVGICLNRNYI